MPAAPPIVATDARNEPFDMVCGIGGLIAVDMVADDGGCVELVRVRRAAVLGMAAQALERRMVVVRRLAAQSWHIFGNCVFLMFFWLVIVLMPR